MTGNFNSLPIPYLFFIPKHPRAYIALARLMHSLLDR